MGLPLWIGFLRIKYSSCEQSLSKFTAPCCEAVIGILAVETERSPQTPWVIWIAGQNNLNSKVASE